MRQYGRKRRTVYVSPTPQPLHSMASWCLQADKQSLPKPKAQVNGVVCKDPFLSALLVSDVDIAEERFREESRLAEEYSKVELDLQKRAEATSKYMQQVLELVRVRPPLSALNILHSRASGRHITLPFAAGAARHSIYCSAVHGTACSSERRHNRLQDVSGACCHTTAARRATRAMQVAAQRAAVLHRPAVCRAPSLHGTGEPACRQECRHRGAAEAPAGGAPQAHAPQQARPPPILHHFMALPRESDDSVHAGLLISSTCSHVGTRLCLVSHVHAHARVLCLDRSTGFGFLGVLQKLRRFKHRRKHGGHLIRMCSLPLHIVALPTHAPGRVLVPAGAPQRSLHECA